jgi:hypothetical protein
MCLNFLDPKIKRHRTGFKVLNRKGADVFNSHYSGDKQYKVGVWYKDISEEKLVFNTQDGVRQEYKTGFHYLLEIPLEFDDEKLNKYCYDENKIIALIEVKKVTATGLDSTTAFGNLKSGVAKEFRIKKILYGKIGQIKKYMKFKLPEICKDMLLFYVENKTKARQDIFKKFKEMAMPNIETWFNFIRVLDEFSRSTDFFKFYTNLHFYGVRKDDEYELMYFHFLAPTMPGPVYMHMMPTDIVLEENKVKQFMKLFKDNHIDNPYEKGKCYRLQAKLLARKLKLPYHEIFVKEY